MIPWRRGGPNTVDNIQLLCGTCNRRKGADDLPADLPPSPYRQPWRSPTADSLRSQPPGTYKSPPPLSYCSSTRWSQPAQFAGCCLPFIPARLAPATGEASGHLQIRSYRHGPARSKRRRLTGCCRPSRMAIGRVGCCTQLLYGVTRASKTPVKAALTSDLFVTCCLGVHFTVSADLDVPRSTAISTILSDCQ